MEMTVKIGDEKINIDLPTPIIDGRPFPVRTPTRTVMARWESLTRTLFLQHDGGYETVLRLRHSNVRRQTNDCRATVNLDVPTRDRYQREVVVAPAYVGRVTKTGGKKGGLETLSSPITGKVIKVLKQEGELVSPTDAVIIIEAMKMENTIESGLSGTIKTFKAREGQTILIGEMILAVEPTDET